MYKVSDYWREQLLLKGTVMFDIISAILVTCQNNYNWAIQFVSFKK